ncbi:hypothetical protein RchiOBHm_Chr6g0265131 [Rosa chinensis]|uniref:Uncharacterized protein n=1 Tax=Rosa chinensis TaxID=74649 RepID=A0A2P6PPD3_ROSCH|nr:hypothetical protein RchiOBHm_Chr6g0265131 [Rosa chinensis]
MGYKRGRMRLWKLDKLKPLPSLGTKLGSRWIRGTMRFRSWMSIPYVQGIAMEGQPLACKTSLIEWEGPMETTYLQEEIDEVRDEWAEFVRLLSFMV